MILLIDNYDSFTYNLYQMIEELGFSCRVVRNDHLSLEELAALNPTHLIVSPGPGRPEDAGVSMSAINYFAGRIPVLGVCLGHQAISLCFGGKVILSPAAFHGKCSPIQHDQQGLFKNVPMDTRVARYHSLMVSDLPACLGVTAATAEGIIMGIQHKELNVSGVQFHPESYATENGRQMLANFLAEAA